MYSDEDRKKKELIEEKNMAETLIYTSEKTLKDAGDKVSQDTRKEVEGKINDLKKVVNKDNIEEIKQKAQELSQVIQKVGTQMYQQEKKEEKKDKGKEGETGEGEFKKK